MRNRSFAACVAAMLITTTLPAAAKTFTIGGASPAQQIAQVESVTEFETFTGRTDKVSGTIRFDPATSKGSGKIIVDASSIDTGIDLRDEHMRSNAWLDTARYPTITFESINVRKMKKDTYKVYGRLSMHGVTKMVTATATMSYLPQSASTRNAGFKGDVVRLKTSLSVKLSDHKVLIPAQAKGKVGETVKISITVYGQTG